MYNVCRKNAWLNRLQHGHHTGGGGEEEKKDLEKGGSSSFYLEIRERDISEDLWKNRNQWRLEIGKRHRTL